MSNGFRETEYEVVKGLRGVWLCEHGGPPHLGSTVITVEIPDDDLQEEWRLDCLCRPGPPIPGGDWCIPAEIVNRYPRRMEPS